LAPSPQKLNNLQDLLKTDGSENFNWHILLEKNVRR